MDRNRELEEALAECARLRDENRRLRLLLKHSEEREAIAVVRHAQPPGDR